MGQYESITEKDKKIIHQVWTVVSTDLSGYGAALFIVIFTDYPLMANFFPFSGPGDEKFELHTRRFMNEFDTMVKNLEKPTELKKILDRNGTNHGKRNIDPEQYVRMQKSFLKAMVGKMGVRRFGEEEQQTFDKVLTLVMNQIVEAGERDRVRRGVTLY